MSKTHLSSSASDIDAELDEFLKGKQPKAVVQSAEDYPDPFSSGAKKKMLIQRLILQILSFLHLR